MCFGKGMRILTPFMTAKLKVADDNQYRCIAAGMSIVRGPMDKESKSKARWNARLPGDCFCCTVHLPPPAGRMPKRSLLISGDEGIMLAASTAETAKGKMW